MKAALSSLIRQAHSFVGNSRKTVTLVKVTAINEDPATKTYAKTTTETDFQAIVAAYRSNEIDDTNIKQSDRKVVAVGAVALSANEQDALEIDGVNFNIIGRTVDPTGTQVTLQVRA